MIKRVQSCIINGLLLLTIFVCGVDFGYANSSQPTRYWLENGSQPRHSYTTIFDDRALTLNFSSDKSSCERNYGSNWGKVCNRNVGDILPSVKDIRLEPHHAGTWKWTSDTTLRFYPTSPWPANQRYTVYIGEKSLPKYTILKQNPRFMSKPLIVGIDASFKFDPDQYKNMMISGVLIFNYPVDKSSVLDRFTFDIFGESNSSLLLGEPEFTMDADNQTLYYNVPILQLPKQATQVRVSLTHGYRPEYGGGAGSGDNLMVKVPAKASMFRVEKVRTQVLNMPDLSAKQTLNFEFSLPVLPKNIVKDVEAYLMPRQRIDSKELKNKPPYKWWNLKEVNNELLKKSRSIHLTMLNNPDSPTRFVSFVVDKPIEDDRYIYVNVNKGLQGPEDYILVKGESSFIRVSALYSDIKIMQTGSVLSLGGDKKISLYGRNLDTISYKIYQIRPEYLNIYARNLSGQSREFSNSLSLETLSIISKGTISLPHENSEKAQFSSLSLAPFLNETQKGIFALSLTGRLKGVNVAEASRFIMLTDIGIVRKENGDGSSRIYAVSLKDGNPMSGVNIEVLGRNGIAIFQSATDSNGVVNAPSLKTYKDEKYPVVVVANSGEDLAFMPYQHSANTLDVSRAYTGGKTSVGGGMYGFIFNQRDLYKPGETAYFGFILKQGDLDSSSLAGIPLEISIYNSKEKVVKRQKVKLNPNGFGEISYKIPAQAITGTYGIRINMADEGTYLLNESFQVQEFEPETLRLDVEFNLPSKKGWYVPREIKEFKIEATLMNLFGTPAADHLISGSVSTNSASFRFSQYAEWNFYDAARLERSKNYDFISINSDEKGRASFTIPTPLFEKESARLNVVMRGFNASGSRSVMKTTSIFVSPLEAVLGWKSSANLDYISQDVDASLEIMAVDSSLNPYNFGNFTMEYYAVEYVRSLVKNNRGEYVYRKERKETLLESTKHTLTKKVLEWNLDTKKSGEKLLIAKDANGRILLRIPYTVAGESISQFGEMNSADLRAKINKSAYESGEQIEIYMHLPYDGAGLITIERENVLSQEWFKAKRGERIQKITVPAGFEGRAYLNVLYFRDLQDADIFTKPSASIVLPFTANLKKRELDISLKLMPDTLVEGTKNDAMPVVRPGSSFQVKIESENASQAIVYAVDEGILQMTGYRTPNPLYELLVHRALEVSTYQYFDLLMPEYGVLAKYLSKFGGDMMYEMASTAKNANAFRRKGVQSVAFWSGIVDVDSDGTLIDIPVPATFNGQLRIMAIAVSNAKMNFVQKQVLAQSEVVIQPSIPYFVAPGDEFVANVTLTDMTKNAAKKGREWKLSVKTSKALRLLDDNDISITLEPEKQTTLSLRFKVESPHKMSKDDLTKLLGSQEILFNLSHKKSRVSMPMSLSVRPAVGLQNIIHFGQLTKNGSKYTKKLEFENNWYPQLSEISVSMSQVPLSIVQGLVETLRDKVYICTPQRLSVAFPLLTIMQNKQFALAGKKYTEEAMGEDVERAIQNLTGRYVNDAHFSMWPSGYGRSSIFDNAYIADFLVEAQNMGISLPYSLRSNFLNGLESQISGMPDNIEEARSFAYGAWVLTQNGVITSNIMSNLVSWLDKNGGNWKQDIVAPLMAASMDLMMEENIAKRLLSGYVANPNKAWSWLSELDGLGERALYLSIIAKQFPENLDTRKTHDVVSQMMALIGSKHFGDTSAALAARSLMQYSVAKEKHVEEISWNMRLFNDRDRVLLTNESDDQTKREAVIQSEDGMLVSSVKRLEMKSNLPLYYHLNALGYPMEMPLESTSSGLEISREYRDLDGNILSELKAGEDIIVAIRAKVRSESSYQVSIVDLLPAAFELIIAEGGQMSSVSTEEGQAMSSLNVNQTEDDMHTLYVDRREDRMIIYATIDNNETVFRYRVRVAHKGNFVIPPIQGEALNNPTIQAITIMDFGRDKDFMRIK